MQTGPAAESSQPEFMTPVKAKPASGSTTRPALNKETSNRTVQVGEDKTRMRNGRPATTFRHDSRSRDMLTPNSKQTVM